MPIRILLVTLLIALGQLSFAQLSGIYSIDSTGTGSKNIVSLDSAFKLLKTNGISGHVTFELADGIHNIKGTQGHLLLDGVGTDSSKTLTITSSSSNSVLCKIIGNLEFQDIDYLKINQVTISPKLQNFDILRILNSPNVWVKNVFFSSNSAFKYSAANLIECKNLNFSNNKVQNTRGLAVYGRNVITSVYKDTTRNVIIEYNEFNSASTPIIINSCDTVKIAHNRINSGILTTYQGIYIYGTKKLEITTNSIKGSIQSPLAVSKHEGSAKNRALIANNEISSSFGTGRYDPARMVQIYQSQYVDVFHNNIVSTSKSYKSTIIILSNSDSLRCLNNIMKADSHVVVSMYRSHLAVCNYNMYDSRLANYIEGYSYVSNIANWNTRFGYESNGKEIDPKFQLTNYLFPTNDSLKSKGIGITKVSKDYFGNNRSTTSPTPGAYEWNKRAIDVGLSPIVSVNCTTNGSISARIINYGTNNITSIRIKLSLDSSGVQIVKPDFVWTGTLTPNSYIDTVIGIHNFVINQEYKWKAYSLNPNSQVDSIPWNDTLEVISWQSPLRDTVTIGSGKDFSSVSKANKYFENYGHCGNITYLLTDAQYRDTISFKFNTGADTLFIEGLNTAKFTNSPITINNSPNVVWNDVKFEINYSANLFTLSAGGYLEFENCHFSAPTSTLKPCLQFYNSENTKINNCTFQGGSYSIYESNNLNKNLSITNSSFVVSGPALRLNGSEHIRIENCKFQCKGGVAQAIQVQPRNSMILKRNLVKLDGQTSLAGIYVIASNRQISPFILENNIIELEDISTGYGAGIALSGCDSLVIAHNTIKINSGSKHGSGISISSSKGYQIKNNLIHSSDSMYGIKVQYYNASDIKNNTYYSTGKLRFLIGTIAFNSLASYHANSFADSNSVNIDPRLSAYYITNPAALYKGNYLPSFPKDKNGKLRSLGKTNCGALEVDSLKLDLEVSNIFNNPSCPGLDSVFCVLKNTGINTLKKAAFIWNVDSGNGSTYFSRVNYSSTLASNKKDTLYMGQFRFSGVKLYDMTLILDTVDGVKDSLQANDTITSTLGANISGRYTVDALDTTANYKSLNSLLDIIQNRKICDTLFIEVIDSIQYPNRNLYASGNVKDKPVLVFEGRTKNSVLSFAGGKSSNLAEIPVVFKNLNLINTSYGVKMSLKQKAQFIVDNCTMKGELFELENSSPITSVNRTVFFKNSSFLGSSMGSRSSLLRFSKVEVTNCVFLTNIRFALVKVSDTLIFTGNRVVLDTINPIDNTNLTYINEMVAGKRGVFENNRLYSNRNFRLSGYGISDPWTIKNNEIVINLGTSSSNYPAISFTDMKKSVIANNSISVYRTGGIGKGSAVQLYDFDSSRFYNNVIVNHDLNLSTSYCIDRRYCSADTLKNNCYYTGDSLQFLNGGSKVKGISNWNTITGDANSFVHYPSFHSKYHLLSLTSQLDSAGIPLSGVTKDINGKVRSTTKPDVGAYEFAVLANDVRIKSLFTNSVCQDSLTAKVILSNVGNNLIQSAQILLRYGSSSDTILTTFNSLNLSPGRDTSLSLKPISISSGTVYSIVAYSKFPNSTGDSRVSNDTIRTTDTIYNPLNGNYAVGTSGNYLSLSEFAKHVNVAGVCGAVTVFLTDTLYELDSLVLNGIKGLSATNTLRITKSSSLAKKPLLNDPYMNLQQVSNITIDSLDIKFIFRSYIILAQSVSNITIKDNFFSNFDISGNLKFNAIYINISNDVKNFISNIKVSGNKSIGGSNLVYANQTGSVYDQLSNIEISHNQCDSIRRAIYISGAENIKVIGNKFSANYHIYSSDFANFNQVSNIELKENQFIDRNISHRTSNSFVVNIKGQASAGMVRVFNNYFYSAKRQAKVFNYNSSDSLEMFYNTMVSSYNSTTNYSYSRPFSNITPIPNYQSIKNNVFISYGDRSSAVWLYKINSGTHIDHNLYDAPNSTPFYANGSNYNFTNWKSTLKLDSNSYFEDPQLISLTKPRIGSANADSGAVVIAGLTHDIYGNKRDTLKPDIGCVEYVFVNNAMRISDLGLGLSCPGTGTIQVKVKNLGKTILDSFSIRLWDNNLVKNKVVWFKSMGLASQRDTLVTLDTISLSKGGKYYLNCTPDSVGATTISPLFKDTLNTTEFTAFSGLVRVGTGSGFTTINQLIGTLDTAGICGPLTIKLTDTLYNERIKLKAIDGLSNVNRITFEGSSSAKNPYSKISSSLPFEIKNAGFFEFDSIHIAGSSNYSVWLFDTVSTLKFRNCLFSNSSSSGNHIYGYYGQLLALDSIAIEKCRFEGTGGIRLAFNTDTTEYALLDSCVFNSISGIGFQINRLKYGTFTRNIFSDEFAINNMSGSDVLLINTFGEVTITNNVLKSTKYGLTFASLRDGTPHPTSTRPSALVSNNMLSTTFSDALIVTLTSKATITHNTINVGGNFYSRGGVRLVAVKKSKFLNNIINSVKRCMWISSISKLDSVEIDNNVYFANDEILKNGNSNYTLSTWKSNFGYDSKSVFLKVDFKDSTDLHTNDIRIAQKGKYLTQPLFDIDGDSRDNPPTAGADKMDTLQIDAKLENVVLNLKCKGVDSIRVAISNLGNDTIKSVSVAYAVSVSDTNYVWRDTTTVTFSLASKKQDTVTLGGFNFNRIGKYSVNSVVLLVNGGLDSNIRNNKATISDLETALNGTYIVGIKNGHWKSLTDFNQRLKRTGLCGPTVIKLDSMGNISTFILDTIKGSSTTNTLTIESINKLKPFTFKLITSAYISLTHSRNTTLRNFNIEFYDSRNSRTAPLILGSKCKNVLVKNINIKSRAGSRDWRYGILIDNFGQFENIKIDSCDISNVEIGISAKMSFSFTPASEGLQISNCNIHRATTAGIEVQHIGNVEITRNKIDSAYRSSQFGIIASYLDTTEITKNEVHAARAFALSNISRYDTTKTLIANNFLAGTVTFNYVRFVDFIYNSVNSGNYAIEFGSSFNSTSNRVVNNIFKYGSFGLPYNSSWSSFTNNSQIDYNVYHNTKDTSWKLTAWVATSSLDSNSHQLDPGYASWSDLHIFNDSIDSLGTSFNINTDIDDELRSSSYYTPGADFRFIYKRDLSLNKLLDNRICEDTLELKFEVQNVGEDTVKFYDFVWYVDTGNGGLVITDTVRILDTLKYGEQSFAYIPKRFYKTRANLKVAGRVINPNGLADLNPSNDSTSESLTFQTGPKITWYSFNKSIPDRYCQSPSPIAINVSPYKGVFNSKAVQFRRLIPDSLQPGAHQLTYTVHYNGNCSTSSKSNVFYIKRSPKITQIAQPKDYCLNGEKDTLKLFLPTGGIYLESRVTPWTVFDPSHYHGVRKIRYNVGDTLTGCGRNFEFDIVVHDTTDLRYQTKKYSCINFPDTLDMVIPRGGTYSGAGIGLNNILRPWVPGVGKLRFKYAYTDTNNCISRMDSTLEILTMPNKPILVGDTVVCGNRLKRLTVTPVSGVDFEWYNYNIYWGQGNSKIPNKAAGINIIRVRAKNKACKSDFDTLRVRVKAIPAAVISTQNINICETDTVKKTAQKYPIGLPVKAYWYNLVDTLNPIDSGTTFNRVINPGKYEFAVKGYLEGCWSDVLSFKADVDSMPNIDLGPDVELCKSSLVLSNTVKLNDYRWSTGSRNPTITVFTTGLYRLLSFNGTCFAQDTIRVLPCSVGIPEMSSQSDVQIFPNPVKKGSDMLVKINDEDFNSEIEIKLINSQGQIVYRNDQIKDISKSIVIKTDEISTGNYVLQISNQKSILNYKVVIIH